MEGTKGISFLREICRRCIQFNRHRTRSARLTSGAAVIEEAQKVWEPC